MLVNSKWLDVRLDGVEQPQAAFSHPPRPERNVAHVVAMMRRASALRQSMPAHTFRAMLNKMCIVMDIFEVAVVDDGAITGDNQLDEIPPLRQRISQMTTAGILGCALLTLFNNCSIWTTKR